MYEEEDFYQFTEQYVTLFKDGKELGSGFLCYTIMCNEWSKEYEDHEREIDDCYYVLNGKVIEPHVDFDEDHTEWGEEKELSYSNDRDEIYNLYQDTYKEFESK